MNFRNVIPDRDKKFAAEPRHSRSKSIYPEAFGLLGFLILWICFLSGAVWAEKISEETNRKVQGLRIPFILNQGQMNEQVRFYARTFSGQVFVTKEQSIVYALPQVPDQNRRQVLVEEVVDRLPVKEIKGEGPAEAKVSYFKGRDPSKWKTDLPTYEGVDLGEVYAGIKLKLRAYGGSMEKLFYVSPGKNSGEIRMKVKGSDSLKVNARGELEVQTGLGPVIFSRPKAFQMEGDRKEAVEVAYLVQGDSYGFKVGGYDVSKELIIDPLIQSTYLGGSGDDYLNALAVSGGNVYLTGYTYSSDFPGTTWGVQPAGGGGIDSFVALLSGDLKTLIQSTYFGGSGDDYATALAITGGNVYLTGYTYSSDFPGTTGGARPAYGGGGDAFVTLLSADLKTLTQSTYLGGTGNDQALSIAESGGSVYVAGYTTSNNFPGTTGGPQPAYGGTGDAFVALLSADLKTLTQSTYLGGAASDSALSLAVSGGNIYVAGFTQSSIFPGTTGGAQQINGGGTDAFVSLLSADLKTLTQSTFLGGNGNDYTESMVLSGGNVYLAGETYSSNLPGTTGGAQPAFGGGIDGFVALLSGDLKTLVQSTYLGGSDFDWGYSLAVSAGQVYVAGYTISSDFPGTAAGVQPAYGGGGDAFLARLGGDLKTLVQSTYLGGTANDQGLSLAVSGGDVYLAGVTLSSDFPSTSGGLQPAGGGGFDVFVALLSSDLKKQAYDFNGDGKVDLLWRNSTTGENAVWTMNGANMTGFAYLPAVSDIHWQIAGIGDFNRDGSPDLVWRNSTTGENVVWYMNGVNMTGFAYLPPVSDIHWQIARVGDFNGDGQADLLWRNSMTGENVVWYMNGVNMTGFAYLPAVSDMHWQIVGIGDFNRDGSPDLVWRNSTTGENVVWYMNGVNMTGFAYLPPVSDIHWQITGAGDFNGDGNPDLVWRNNTTGENVFWFMNGVNLIGGTYLSPVGDLNWSIVGP